MNLLESCHDVTLPRKQSRGKVTNILTQHPNSAVASKNTNKHYMTSLIPLWIVCVCVFVQNYVRVVEVWWDDYKDYFYASRPETLTLAYGDISALKRFRYNTHSTHVHIYYFNIYSSFFFFCLTWSFPPLWISHTPKAPCTQRLWDKRDNTIRKLSDDVKLALKFWKGRSSLHNLTAATTTPINQPIRILHELTHNTLGTQSLIL